MRGTQWIAAVLIGLAPACGSDGPGGPGREETGTGPAWEWQNPLPHNNLYRGIAVLDDGRVVTVSDHEVLISGDDGATWRELHAPGDYRDLHHRGDVVAILTPERVLVSGDNGGSFRASTPHGVNPRGVAFFDAAHGVVVGRETIVETDDGGDTWAIRLAGATLTVNDVEYLDEQTVFAVADDQLVFRSTDGGVNWNALPTTPFSGDLLAIDITAGVVHVTGTARIVYVSTDTGDTWTGYDVNTTGALRAIDFLDPSVGIVSGEDGFAGVTTTAGVDWNDVSPGADGVLYEAVALPGGKAYVAGEIGEIFRTTSAGTSWSQLRTGPFTYLLDASYNDPDRGVAVGVAEPASGSSDVLCGILYTTDGGATWSRGQAGNTACAGNNFNRVAMTDATHAVAVGSDGVIWTTDDGGATWTVRNSGTTDDLYDVDFADATCGLAVGANGRKRITGDGGITWSAGVAGTNTTEELRGVSMATRNVAIAVGRNGTIRRTINGGQTWAIVDAGLDDYQLHDVVMLNEMTVVTVGSDSGDDMVFRSTDGGTTWEPRAGIVLFDDATIAFATAELGFITGYEVPRVYVTEDGGITWDRIEMPSRNALGVASVGTDGAAVIGRGGTILRLTLP